MNIKSKQTDAIILALSSKRAADFAQLAPNGRKPFVKLNGKPAISYLIYSLRQCSMLNKVILVTDCPDCDCVPEADASVLVDGDMNQAVLAGIGSVTAGRCLLMSGDMPLASSGSVADLLENAPDGDIVYPIVEKTDMARLMPGKVTFYLDTKEGSFTGSSCLLFDSQIAISRQSVITRLLCARSDPRQLLGLLGPGLALKLMLGRTSIDDLQTQLSNALDMNCRVYITKYAELLISIDSTADVPLIEKHLSLPA